MASPFTAFIAGMGTVVAALGLGFSTVLMFMPSVSQKEPAPQRRAEPAPVELRFVVADPPAVKSQLITAAQTPMISSPYAAPPPLWSPSSWRSTTGQASREPALASDPGVRQIPVRPALSAEAATAAASAQPDTQNSEAVVTAEPKKKKKIVQRKPRNQFADQPGYALAGNRSSYAPDRRGQSPLGFLGLFLGDSTR